MQTNILEAKNRLSQLIKAAQAGEEVVIANRGEPVVRLVPVRNKADERGSARAILDWLDAHPLPKHARRSAKEIDAYIKEERESWD
jgi:prevent-host-death family protein